MKRSYILVLLIILSLLLIACVGSEIVRKSGAEAIDTAGCKLDCKRAGLEFYDYDYRSHTCKGKPPGGEIITLYGLEVEE